MTYFIHEYAYISFHTDIFTILLSLITYLVSEDKDLIWI